MSKLNASDCTGNISEESSPKTLDDVCWNLKRLQDGQTQLVKQIENLALTLNAFLDVQQGLSTGSATLARQFSEEPRTTEPCNRPAQERSAIAIAGLLTMPMGPYPQFNAGQRLTNTSELVEMILLELPSQDILFAQRVNNHFRSIIARSHPLQVRLFLATQPATLVPKNIILNPIISKEMVLARIPLYFDDKKVVMGYCHRGDRKRVYCTEASIAKDKTTGQEWVNLKLTDFHIRLNPDWFGEVKTRPFGAGSWKQMCLSQPPCEVKWHLTIAGRYTERRYSGTVSSSPTMDALLDVLAATKVVDEGEHRRPNR